MKKEILFILYTLDLGGVEKSLVNLLRHIPLKEYEITLLLMEKRGKLINELPSDVRIVESKYYKKRKILINAPIKENIARLLNKKRFFQAALYASYALFARISGNLIPLYNFILKSEPKIQNNYDVCIAYAGPSALIDYFCVHKVEAKEKIGWIHYDVKKFPISYRSCIRLHKEYKYICSVSEQAKHNYTSLFPCFEQKTKIIKNVVDRMLIYQQANKQVFSDAPNICKLLTVGRLSPEKGQRLALKAAHLLKMDGIKFKWYFIGEGIDFENLKNIRNELKLEEEVVFLGAKSNPYPYFRYCDIYVQPSLHEGFCITIAEALCFSNPIIATDFTGAREQLQCHSDCRVVQHDATQMKNAIVDCVTSDANSNKKHENRLIPKEPTGINNEINSVFDNFISHIPS